MARNSIGRIGGPLIVAVDPWAAGKERSHQLLTDDERARLAVMATIVRFKKGEEIYRKGESAKAIFNIISGVVKAYSGDAPKHIIAFLFPGDLFGLSKEGTFTNSAEAVTPVTAYRIPVSALRGWLPKDAALEYHVICKLFQDLRQSQQHSFLLAQRRAEAKIAIFLQMMEQLQDAKGGPTNEIYMPMDRSDISEYVGMTLPAVSRTFRNLSMRGVIKIRDRRHVKIVNRNAFEQIIIENAARCGARSKRNK